MPAFEKKTEVSFWRVPALKAELLRGRFVDFSYDVHTHETACFALLTQGAIKIKMRGNEFIARRGDVYAIDADEPHAGWAIDPAGWHLRTMYVDMSHLTALIDGGNAARQSCIAGPILRDPQLSRLFHAMHRSAEENSAPLFRDEAYLRFASAFMRRHVQKPIENQRTHAEQHAVQSVRDYLDQHLEDKVSLDELAQLCGLPALALFRAFERATGMTPHEYQRQARVRLALKLIKKRMPLAEVSMMSGFTDQAHLTRWFRRLMGITPGQYRNAL